MLWFRGLLFTVLGPGVIGGLIPYLLVGDRPLRGGPWMIGWVPVAVGCAILFSCVANFLLAGGTPAPFVVRRMRAIVGEEPARLVCSGLYRFSRNPMYVAMILVVFGQAIVFGSWAVALYGVGASLFFHVSVIRIEEPHLRAKQAAEWDDYCRRVPRWLGRPK